MSMPVGPSGIIGVKRIISRGLLAGLASGLGIAIGDLLFATLLLTGISSISEWILQNQGNIQLLGSFIVMLAGLYGLRHPPKSVDTATTNSRLSLLAMRDLTSMLAITLANPQTIIGFSTSFAATVSFYSLQTNAEVAAIAGGIFAGSLTTWIFLSWFFSHWRGQLDDALIARLHRYASLFVVFVGICLLFYSVRLGLT